MKRMKEKVFETTRQLIYSNSKYKEGVDTNIIADAVGIQRSNTSKLLNELVNEEKLVKSTTRPVVYRLSEKYNFPLNNDCFEKIIGRNGSYKKAIQLTKAAILYPNQSLNILILGESGSGISYFASLVYEFFIESLTLKNNAPFVKVDCRRFYNDVDVLDNLLFGDNMQESFFDKAREGVLFIESFDVLKSSQQSRIYDFLESKKIYHESSTKDYSDVYLLLAVSAKKCPEILRRNILTVEISTLRERSIAERYELISSFFREEALHSSQTIEVSTDVLKALLLADCSNSLKQMKNEIISACASAYFRVVNLEDESIFVSINDLNDDVRMGLLLEKEHKLRLVDVLSEEGSHIFEPQREKLSMYKETVYSNIKKEYDRKQDLEMNTIKLENIIDDYIKSKIESYEKDDPYNIRQLEKIVDKKVIDTVLEFIDQYRDRIGNRIRARVFYGLCLHIFSLYNRSNTEHIDEKQAREVVDAYPEEFSTAEALSRFLSEHLNLNLDRNQNALLTLFFVDHYEDSIVKKPVLLYVMHGNGTAKSLRDVTNELSKCDNAYGYDVNLDSNTSDVILDLKKIIPTIDKGGGVIVIYDMGSIRTMLESIEKEIPTEIRYMSIPITLIGIDVARKCLSNNDINDVCHTVASDFELFKKEKNKPDSIIITLCHTGEGGAIELKKYIDKNSKLAIRTIALAISDKQVLIDEVKNLHKIYNIHAFVGTYDPKLLGIPFIPINKIFEIPSSYLDNILMFRPIESSGIDYEQVYEQLGNDFKYASISKIKNSIPEVVDELGFLYKLDIDQITGLFIHLACLVERTVKGDKIDTTTDYSEVISKFQDDYNVISRILKKVEKKFTIIINDKEIADLIAIVNKIYQ